MGQKLDTGCQFNLLQFLTAFFSGQLLACGFGLEFSTGAYLGVAQLFPIKTSPSYLYPFSIPSISDLSSLFPSILFFHRHFTAGFPSCFSSNEFHREWLFLSSSPGLYLVLSGDAVLGKVKILSPESQLGNLN